MWIPCSKSLPDSETTVMTFAPESCEPVWPAYHDGEKWTDLMGAPIVDAPITHWMDFPDPPGAAGSLEAFIEQHCLQNELIGGPFRFFYQEFSEWWVALQVSPREALPSRKMVGYGLRKLGFPLHQRKGELFITGLSAKKGN